MPAAALPRVCMILLQANNYSRLPPNAYLSLVYAVKMGFEGVWGTRETGGPAKQLGK